MLGVKMYCKTVLSFTTNLAFQSAFARWCTSLLGFAPFDALLI